MALEGARLGLPSLEKLGPERPRTPSPLPGAPGAFPWLTWGPAPRRCGVWGEPEQDSRGSWLPEPGRRKLHRVSVAGPGIP